MTVISGARAAFSLIEIAIAAALLALLTGPLFSMLAGGHRNLVQMEELVVLQGVAARVLDGAAKVDFARIGDTASWVGDPPDGVIVEARVMDTGDPDLKKVVVEVRRRGRFEVTRLVARTGVSLGTAIALP